MISPANTISVGGQKGEHRANKVAFRAFNGIALKWFAIRQASESADAAGPAGTWRYRPHWSRNVFFRDNAKDKRIEYGEAALPLVPAIPNDDAGVVGQSADVVPDFSVLHRRVQRGACM